MEKIISCLFLFSISISVCAQTTINIIGTMHNPAANVDDKTILAVLVKMAPDVVLVELDSSLMDSTGKVLYQFKSKENCAVDYVD